MNKSINGLRCDYCGRFIGWREFAHGWAERWLLTPDSEISIETWETYHIACKKKDREQPPHFEMVVM